jgi:hypothetical protein
MDEDGGNSKSMEKRDFSDDVDADATLVEEARRGDEL